MNNKQNNEVKSRSIFAEIIHLLLTTMNVSPIPFRTQDGRGSYKLPESIMLKG